MWAFGVAQFRRQLIKEIACVLAWPFAYAVSLGVAFALGWYCASH